MSEGPVGALIETDRSSLINSGQYDSQAYQEVALEIISRWEGYLAANNRTLFYIEYAALVEGSIGIQTAASISSFSGVLGYWGLIGNALAASYLGEEYHSGGIEAFSQQIAVEQLAFIKGEVLAGRGIEVSDAQIASVAEVKWTPDLGPGAKLELAVPSC
jgi:hypothetical protein